MGDSDPGGGLQSQAFRLLPGALRTGLVRGPVPQCAVLQRGPVGPGAGIRLVIAVGETGELAAAPGEIVQRLPAALLAPLGHGGLQPGAAGVRGGELTAQLLPAGGGGVQTFRSALRFGNGLLQLGDGAPPVEAALALPRAQPRVRLGIAHALLAGGDDGGDALFQLR